MVYNTSKVVLEAIVQEPTTFADCLFESQNQNICECAKFGNVYENVQMFPNVCECTKMFAKVSEILLSVR